MGRALRGLPWALAAVLACAGAPELSEPGRSGVWGYVRLVPHEGVAPQDTAGASSGYGDRRYADVELVDYSKPGFAVVYLDDAPGGAEWTGRPAPLALALEGGAGGLRFEPAQAAVAVDGRILVTNRSGDARVVSCPEAGLLRLLADGEAVAIPVDRAGELELFAPDRPGARARLFAAPGPFAVVSAAGRYDLVDVKPGARTLRVWHSRFPPAERRVELAPGSVARVDLELGVGLGSEGSAADAR